MLSPGRFAGVRSRRTVVLIAALLAATGTARLGFWQLDRAQQKIALQDRIESRAELPPLLQTELARTPAMAADQHYRRITLRGRWLVERTVYLDNRQMAARQGFFVITPLLLASGDAVLVQRGWAPRDFIDRSQLPALPTPAGEVLVTGRIAPPPSKLFELGAAGSGPIRQNLEIAAFAAEIGVALRPVSVQQTRAVVLVSPDDAAPRSADADLEADLSLSATTESRAAAPAIAAVNTLPADPLLRQWPAPAVDVGKHYGYAFQWFALCALISGLALWFQIIRPRLKNIHGRPT
jgi:surfeit locus 1 family protein